MEFIPTNLCYCISIVNIFDTKSLFFFNFHRFYKCFYKSEIFGYALNTPKSVGEYMIFIKSIINAAQLNVSTE